MDAASPEKIAHAADRSAVDVAFTYNDPVLLRIRHRCRGRMSLMRDESRCGDSGLHHRRCAGGILRHMDAANVDLKALTEEFYHRLCFAELTPVLETLKYSRH